MKTARAQFRRMTEEEYVRASLLGNRCRFSPGTFAKRFAAKLYAQATQTGLITEKQSGMLAIQCYVFRRQLPPGIAPKTPPPGYLTPKERVRAAELAFDRAKAEQTRTPETTAPHAPELFQ